MSRENLAFLIAGVAFGMLFGFGVYHAVQTQPGLSETTAATEGPPAPRGPQAPTQVAQGGAPMVAEVNRLKRVLQEEPENVDALRRLANLYHDASMWEQAARYYERALAVRPDDPDMMTDLGVCYRGLRKFDEALESFRRAHEMNRNHWQSLYNTVIVAAFDVNRQELAIEALDTMEAMQPRPPELDQARLDQLRQLVERSREQAGASGES